MSVHVVNRALIVSDYSPHQAKSTGQENWVVSFLPGRTLTTMQATAAIQVAEAAAEIEKLAMLIGLTAREAFWMAVCTDASLSPQPGERPDAAGHAIPMHVAVLDCRRGGEW